MAANGYAHFTGKTAPFRTQKRKKKKPREKRGHKNKYMEAKGERIATARRASQ